MNIPFRHRNQHGAVLLMTLATVAVIAIGLASYLMLVQGESESVARSQAWNNSLVVAEAGVEDSLAFVNQGTTWSNTAAANNWTALSSGVYFTRRYLGTNAYYVYLTNNSDGSVTIKSTGTVPWSNSWFRASAAQRAVLVTTKFRSYSSYGILVKQDISLQGGALLDAFTGSQYLPQNRVASIVIASDATNTANAISITGNGELYGKAQTGPNSTVSISGTASIGDLTWVPTPGIQPGATNSTVNVYIPDAPTAPTGALYVPMPPAVGGVFSLTSLGPGFTSYYTIPSGTTVSGGNTINISGGGVVVVNCLGSFAIAGQSSITVASNTSAVFYLNGTTSLAGGGVINGSGNATNCTYYGSTNCTTLTYSGGAQFVGTINAPQADITDSGGAAYIGSVIGNSFTDAGGAAFHYPLYLSGTNSAVLYTVASWQETSP